MSSTAGDPLAELPTPEMITLLFKCHKSTTVLSILPDTPFSEIKTLLLSALRSRNVTTLPNTDTPLPQDPEQLELGVLADKKDASKGWVPLMIKEQEFKGAKGSKKKIGGEASVLNESPSGAGLNDGTWIAYRFNAKQKMSEDVDMVEADGNSDMDFAEDPDWDVIIPSFDDEDDNDDEVVE
ncbi:uncharacterized protein PV06_07708 [Exophiala oligosperma]|uniref:Uncharacterized protein n=2 Tax=Chaetothyriales TaxID=34395 RepID=A0A0D2BSV8_9EURO|nr:uncharacterized protein PV06_07708 [Exophiala oligosperma]KAJ9645618.1 hypothetical protein H2204_001199 [Knufia peltigerae]KIW40517.1 hypothetical protein PV06_07708 [Exophiala oligosperma]